MTSFDRQIQVIMRDFDFKRVHKAMQALNWTYRADKVPSLQEIKDTLLELIKSTIEDYRGKKVTHSTGGFEVTINNWVELEVSFILEEGQYCSPGDDYQDYFGVM